MTTAATQAEPDARAEVRRFLVAFGPAGGILFAEGLSLDQARAVYAADVLAGLSAGPRPVGRAAVRSVGGRCIAARGQAVGSGHWGTDSHRRAR